MAATALTLPAAPEWLTAREGTLAPGLRGHVALVMLRGEPFYKLEVRPARGKHTCAVVKTVNGARLDGGKIYDTPAAAVAGGLEELREKLGW